MWLTLCVPAFAVDWYLESPDIVDREPAALLEQTAVGAGFEARVVRRFVDGQGWRYLAKIDGFADRGSAEQAAKELSVSTGTGFVVVEVDKGAAQVVAQSAPADPAPSKGPVDGRAEKPVGTVTDALALIARAHGTDGATLERLLTGPTRFSYRRYLEDGRQVDHVWATRKGTSYVEVMPVGGASIVPSRTRVSAGKAEMSVRGGPFLPKDPAPTAAVVASLGPAELLPLVLAVGAAVDGRREFDGMEVVGEGAFDGGQTLRFRYGGDATSGPLELEVGEGDGLIRRIVFDDGALAQEFRDYRPLDGVRVPHDIVTLRKGKVVDRLQVQGLDVVQAGWAEGWLAVVP